jgi:toxin ParE1/3/4
MKLRVFPAAHDDVALVQDWYDDIQAGLSEAFNNELEQALRLLLEQPGIGSRRYAHLSKDGLLRFWALDRFPFLVFYRVMQSGQEPALEVLRVIHERRDIPRLWH